MPHKKKVRIFRQNDSMETCVCCCVLMSLDYFCRLPGGMNHPTRQFEDRLYKYLGYHVDEAAFVDVPYEFTRGTPLAAGAYYLAQRGLEVTIHHGDDEHMDNRHHGNPYYPEDVYPFIRQNYRSWLEKEDAQVTCAKCETLTPQTLTAVLDRGELIVAAICVGGAGEEILHAILLDSYAEADGKLMFHVCDPAVGNRQIDAEDMMRRMDTPVGVQFLSVGEPREE